MANVIATVARIYIYPVKSMAGVAVEEAHIGVNGLLGDRRYAFVRAEQSGSNSFPWMTARQAARMLLDRWATAPLIHFPVARRPREFARQCRAPKWNLKDSSHILDPPGFVWL